MTYKNTPFVSVETNVNEALLTINPDLEFYNCFCEKGFWDTYIENNMEFNFNNFIKNYENKKGSIDLLNVCCPRGKHQNLGELISNKKINGLYRILPIYISNPLETDNKIIDLIKKGNPIDNINQKYEKIQEINYSKRGDNFE